MIPATERPSIPLSRTEKNNIIAFKVIHPATPEIDERIPFTAGGDPYRPASPTSAGTFFGDKAPSDTEREARFHNVASRLIQAREEERSLLAQELHDDLGQKLALLSLELDQLGTMISRTPAARRNFQVLHDRVAEIATDIHRMSHRLHPIKLDHLGLTAAVKSMCRDLTNAGSIEVEFNQEGDFARLPKDTTLCIYRIAQEALRNCTKHSGAFRARVEMVNNGRQLRLSVSDDGRGFDARLETIRHGLGLTSMSERVRAVGGEIVIRSKPGYGTRIDVSIPLPAGQAGNIH